MRMANVERRFWKLPHIVFIAQVQIGKTYPIWYFPGNLYRREIQYLIGAGIFFDKTRIFRSDYINMLAHLRQCLTISLYYPAHTIVYRNKRIAEFGNFHIIVILTSFL